MLLCTDVAARGLDVPDLDAVFQVTVLCLAIRFTVGCCGVMRARFLFTIQGVGPVLWVAGCRLVACGVGCMA